MLKKQTQWQNAEVLDEGLWLGQGSSNEVQKALLSCLQDKEDGQMSGSGEKVISSGFA